MKELIQIVIPTYNNFQYLNPCLNSVLRNLNPKGIGKILVINNGTKESCEWIKHPMVDVVNMKENLGWTGGIKYAFENTDSEFILFLNDDTLIPDSSNEWLIRMMRVFRNPHIGMVGPSSNVVAGNQNIFNGMKATSFYVNYLIGFCLLGKREAIQKAGGIDDTMMGGDDFDLCIRVRDAGYNLICDRSVFVYHHGFKTGTRLFGDHSTYGGWNSQKYKEQVDTELIRKHGFRKWYECLYGAPKLQENMKIDWDMEGKLIKEKIIHGKVLDLGCGGEKTIPEAIGVDQIPKGERIETIDKVSQADVVADVSKPLPFKDGEVDTVIARHILEHMLDPLTCLANWKKIIKPGGKLLMALPDHELFNTIPANLEHVHAFTRASIKPFLTVVGFTNIQTYDIANGISFVVEATV